MRFNSGILWMACVAFALARPLVEANGRENGPNRPNPGNMLAQFKKQLPREGSARPKGDKAAGSSEQKDTRLTLKDIQRLREQHTVPERIVDKVAEQGRGFDVTAEVAEELRRQGFRPVQIDAIKESSPDPLVPGRWLTTSGERRNRVLEELKRVAAKSKADIEPIQSQHVTLWAAKDLHRTYLPDIEKLEKFYHTKCAEPIRSGLDKRAAHIVLLKDRAEFEAWCRAIFDLSPQRFPNSSFREEAIKRPALYTPDMAWISLEDKAADQVHHDVVAGAGIMYFSQLAKPGPFVFGPLQTGFVNWAEATVFGSPTEMYHSVVYRSSNPAEDSRDWSLLVRQRITSHKATQLAELLRMNSSTMWQPHYAEAWTLVELLARQPVKFGKLLLALRKSDSELAAINEVYGWDEKRLTKEWRAFVMTRGVRAKK